MNGHLRGSARLRAAKLGVQLRAAAVLLGALAVAAAPAAAQKVPVEAGVVRFKSVNLGGNGRARVNQFLDGVQTYTQPDGTVRTNYNDALATLQRFPWLKVCRGFAGETLSKIAALHGVSREQLVFVNRVGGGEVLDADRILVLDCRHTVVGSDTLESVCQRYGVTPAELQKFNGWDRPELPEIGKQILVAAKLTTSTYRNGDQVCRMYMVETGVQVARRVQGGGGLIQMQAIEAPLMLQAVPQLIIEDEEKAMEAIADIVQLNAGEAVVARPEPVAAWPRVTQLKVTRQNGAKVTSSVIEIANREEFEKQLQELRDPPAEPAGKLTKVQFKFHPKITPFQSVAEHWKTPAEALLDFNRLTPDALQTRPQNRWLELPLKNQN